MNFIIRFKITPRAVAVKEGIGMIEMVESIDKSFLLEAVNVVLEKAAIARLPAGYKLIGVFNDFQYQDLELSISDLVKKM